MSAKIDVKETGQKKTINGYNASELILTMEMDSPASAQMGKMQMEMDMWLSSGRPGVGEMRAFYQKNMSRFPWAAMAAAETRACRRRGGIAAQDGRDERRAGAAGDEDEGRRGRGGAPAMPQMTPDQMAQMKDAMARLQAQGGPGAARRSRRWLA